MEMAVTEPVILEYMTEFVGLGEMMEGMTDTD